jgi:D-serine deaminase-like pyridoxal phosphate-dependent protein
MLALLSRGPNESLIGRPGSRIELGTPSLVLDLDVLDANIASLAEHSRSHGYALRPVAKVHKSADIARRQIAAGGLGVCCATLAECEVMAEAGIPGVMLFTSVVSAPKLERLAALNARADGLIVVADDRANVAQLTAAARRSGRPLQVLVDVEVGGRRTGIADEGRAIALARLVAEADGLDYAGLQGYVGDHQNTVGYDERRARSRELLQPLVRVVERLHAEGLPPRIVSGGGTGTHDFDHELGVLTELQPGTYALMDVNYRDAVMRRDDPHPFGAALSVRTTVISTAKPGFVITDAGVKELDGIFGIEHPVILRGAPEGATYSLVGDDMGRIEFARPGDRLEVGDVVEVLPPHCYQTLVLYSHFHVVQGDTLVDIWPVSARESW